MCHSRSVGTLEQERVRSVSVGFHTMGYRFPAKSVICPLLQRYLGRYTSELRISQFSQAEVTRNL